MLAGLLRLERLVQTLAARVGRKSRQLAGLAVLVVVALIGLLVWWLHRHPAAVFTPRGQVAGSERSLLFLALALSVIVVLPVFGLTIGIVMKYRETSHRAKQYQPEWDGSRRLESIWWGVPGIIILVLSVVTWNSSHSLDPYRQLVSTKKPLQVQVVSLDWKWLFIYPEQGLATVNYLPLPVDTPVNFELTSGSVMNSFWVPQLGGQIYTMPGMSTQLHLMANQTGAYNGSSANISGKGFADMRFKAQVMTDQGFQSWTQQAQAGGRELNPTQDQLLLKPAVAKQVATYRNVPPTMYESIMLPFMMPEGSEAPLEMSQPTAMDHMKNPDGTMMR